MTPDRHNYREVVEGRILNEPRFPHGTVPLPLIERLKPGEQLIWHGKPLTRLRISFPGLLTGLAAGFIFVPVGIGLISNYFKFFTEYPEGIRLLLVLFGVISIIFGLFGAFYPLFDIYMRSHSFYGITDKRIIIVNKQPLGINIIFDLTRICRVEITKEKADGSGTIEFLINGWYRSNLDNSENPGFDFIGNVREVYNLLLQARKEHTM